MNHNYELEYVKLRNKIDLLIMVMKAQNDAIKGIQSAVVAVQKQLEILAMKIDCRP